jgi:hypothetical protein
LAVLIGPAWKTGSMGGDKLSGGRKFKRLPDMIGRNGSGHVTRPGSPGGTGCSCKGKEMHSCSRKRCFSAPSSLPWRRAANWGSRLTGEGGWQTRHLAVAVHRVVVIRSPNRCSPVLENARRKGLARLRIPGMGGCLRLPPAPGTEETAMVLRHVFSGLALLATLCVAGCCCSHCCKSRACARPAIVGTAPVCCPAPDPCCAPAAVPPPPAAAYSSPAPCCTGLRR